MSKINLGVRFSIGSEAVAVRARYSRVDNVTNPSWITVSPNPVTSPAILAQNIDNGQYIIELTPLTADGRTCTPRTEYTAGCPGLISINAYIQSENIIVQALAPSDVPKIRIVVDYPNGGRSDLNYVNDGTNKVVALPANVSGDFFVYGQSVCDEATGFYSASSNQVTVSKVSYPSITQASTSNTGVGGTRTEVFTVNTPVAAGNRYVLTTYGHDVTVVANSGDTPAAIAIKLRDAVNATTEGQWNDFGSAPASGTTGFKPIATASGSQIIIVLDYTHSFAVNAYVS